MALTLGEARERAAALSDVHYEVALDLTRTDGFGSRTTVRFRSSAASTFLELANGGSVELSVNGTTVDAGYDGARLPLGGLRADGPNEVVVDAVLPYAADGAGMHAFTDPADGERYVCAYLGMDLAQRVFACFDQVDLKAAFAVSVAADPRWTVLANGRPVARADGRWRFAATPPISTDRIVVAAGPWHSVRWAHAGLPFGWHARRSLAAELDRDAAELRATTEACFDHYATLFDEPYGFDSYDQVFVPGLNWGAQEMPGCVTYRDELLPRGAVTAGERTLRGAIVAHEMAHMWFGNSMSMRWWEDTWLQESFADYMGYRVAETAAGFGGALVRFEVTGKPAGYAADCRRSTHPVAPRAEDVPDVDAAFANFDAISYSKGNSVLRQLATWLGDEEFLAGINAHLTRFRFGNATLADFVGSLASVTGRDVHRWVDLWLRSTGFDTVAVDRADGVPVLRRDGVRPHAFTVAAYDDGLRLAGSRLVELGDEPVPLPEYAGLAVVPNALGETFAAIRLDGLSWNRLSTGLSRIAEPLTRAVLWTAVAGQVRSRELGPGDYLALVEAQLPTEPDSAIVQAVLLRALHDVVPTRVPADAAADAVARVAATALAGLKAAPGDDDRGPAFAYALAATSTDPGLLQGWLESGRTGGLPPAPRTRWRAIARLAELGAADAALVESERSGDGSAEAELGAARALAARPAETAKAEAWARLTGDEHISNRAFEAVAAGLWSAEQAELVRPYVAAYLEHAPRLARERGAAFAHVVGRSFPAVTLDDEQLDLLRQALAGDVPTVLRRTWEDELDDRT
ncbi:MAG TPA: aminopeptidase N [Streptosporangiales bacterium]